MTSGVGSVGNQGQIFANQVNQGQHVGPPPPPGNNDVPPKVQKHGIPGSDVPDLPGGNGGDLPGNLLSQLGIAAGSAFDIAAIAKIIIEQNQEARESARLDRAAARDAQMAQQQEAADKIRSQAAFALAAGIISGSLAIAGSALSFVGAVKAQNELGRTGTTSNQTAKQLTDLPDGTGTTPGSTPGTQSSKPSEVQMGINKTVADLINARYSAFGQILTQSGNIAASGFNFAASEEEARKAEAQAEATKAQTLAEDQTDFIRAYADLIQTVLAKLAEAQSQEAQTNQRIVTA